ncbi:rhomboid-related [Anaeramoeba ignava]|uniref:rhomboid protease n=1 Tax=Anaeramoeba ignava TaxID=1746090 RepID=A0A9Q0R8F1_ANAIG|nr:rhomboid-related [Anaeramoeba ignava]
MIDFNKKSLILSINKQPQIQKNKTLQTFGNNPSIIYQQKKHSHYNSFQLIKLSSFSENEDQEIENESTLQEQNHKELWSHVDLSNESNDELGQSEKISKSNNSNLNTKSKRYKFSSFKVTNVAEIQMGLDNENLIVKTYPPSVMIFLTICQIIILIIEVIYNHGFAPLSQNPFFGPSAMTLVELGAKYTPKIRQGQFYRFYLAIFLHAGIIHLVLNLWFQIIYGFQLERYFGGLRIAIIYFLTGISGNLLSAIFLPNVVSVGSSSALFGLLGFMVVDLSRNWKMIESPKRGLIRLLIVILTSFITGLFPIIDNFSHLGGFIMGIMAGALFLPNIADKKIKKINLIIALICICLYFIIGFSIFYKNINGSEWCKVCTYLNCIPIKNWCDSLNN